MAGVDEYSLTPEQMWDVLRQIERGLRGEIDRLTIDFRGRVFYVDVMRRATGTTKYEAQGKLAA